MHRTVVRALAVLLLLAVPVAGPAHATGTTLHAVVTVWPIADVIGFNPTESAEDVAGVTGHVKAPGAASSVVSVVKNAINTANERLVALVYWNPVTNVFKWYGVVDAGSTAGVAVNRTAPVLTGPGCGLLGLGLLQPGCEFSRATFQPGDVWASVQGALDVNQTSLYVNFKGSDNFRKYRLLNLSGVLSGINGLTVDQQTGMIWFTDEIPPGTINRLDPTTNTVTTWIVGGTPHYLAIDPSGKVYATVAASTVAGGGNDAIVRLDPTTNQTVAWPVTVGIGAFQPLPFSALVDVEAPDGIDTDGEGNVWFAESQSRTVGRLEPATNKMTKFTKDEVLNPQQIAAKGQGSSLQVFFTEGGGNSVSIVKPEQIGSVVTPIKRTILPIATTVIVEDEVLEPLQATIVPFQRSVPAVDPEITRFSPMPDPPGALPDTQNHPGGLTDVALSNGVFGNYLDPSFGGRSAMFRLAVQTPEHGGGGGHTSGQMKVAGGGWIPVSGGGHKKASFVLNVKQDPGQAATGKLQFNNHATGDKVHGNVTSLVISGNTATLQGHGTRNGSPCTFTVQVQDNGKPGTSDTFRITGTCANTSTTTLGGGNINIHTF
jgi:hypothetical protein